MPNVNRVVYYVMLAGMILSMGLFLLGLSQLIYSPLPGGPTRPPTPLEGLAALKPSSILMLATLILILTPVGRVFAALVVFTINRDKPYMLISAAILLIILLGVLVSLAGFQQTPPGASTSLWPTPAITRHGP